MSHMNVSLYICLYIYIYSYRFIIRLTQLCIISIKFYLPVKQMAVFCNPFMIQLLTQLSFLTLSIQIIPAFVRCPLPFLKHL